MVHVQIQVVSGRASWVNHRQINHDTLVAVAIYEEGSNNKRKTLYIMFYGLDVKPVFYDEFIYQGLVGRNSWIYIFQQEEGIML